MRQRRKDIQLFSTSAIDILSCGLAAMLVLWLLLLGQTQAIEAGEQPRANAELRFIGIYSSDNPAGSHWNRWNPMDAKPDHVLFSDEFSAPPSLYSTGSPGWKNSAATSFQATNSEGGKLVFEEELSEFRTAVRDLKKPTALRFAFPACDQAGPKVTVVFTKAFDRRGARKNDIGLTCICGVPPVLPPVNTSIRLSQYPTDNDVLKRLNFHILIKPGCAIDTSPIYLEYSLSGDGRLKFSPPVLPNSSYKILQGTPDQAFQLYQQSGTHP